MKCAECQELIQQHLDGLEPANPADLELHLRSCPSCRAEYVATNTLRSGLRLLTPPAPPAGLAGRITAQLQGEQRSRLLWRRRARVVLAVAAAVLLLVSAWLLRPGTPRPDNPPTVPEQLVEKTPKPPEKLPEKPSEEPLDLRESVSQVCEVMVRASTRTKDRAVAEGRAFLPLVSATPAPTSVPPSPEPVRSFKEAGQGVSEGLAPVADSARRAFDLFLRDLPPMGQEEKPGL